MPASATLFAHLVRALLDELQARHVLREVLGARRIALATSRDIATVYADGLTNLMGTLALDEAFAEKNRLGPPIRSARSSLAARAFALASDVAL